MDSEGLARKWLEEKGYSNIEPQGGRGEPDFIADGEEFEVKTVQSGSVIFTSHQMDSFPEIEPGIIAVDGDEIELVPFDKIDEFYNVIVQESASVAINYRLWRVIRKIAVYEKTKQKDLVSEAVREKVEEKYPSYLEQMGE